MRLWVIALMVTALAVLIHYEGCVPIGTGVVGVCRIQR